MKLHGLRHASATLQLGQRTELCTHLVGGWLGPRPELEAVAKRKSVCLLCTLPVCYTSITKPQYESDCKCNI